VAHRRRTNSNRHWRKPNSAPGPRPRPAPEAPPPADATACDATQAQWLVGKTPGQADADQARTDARATSVRLLKPDQPVSMEFNAARLNIELDEKGMVVSVRCG